MPGGTWWIQRVGIVRHPTCSDTCLDSTSMSYLRDGTVEKGLVPWLQQVNIFGRARPKLSRERPLRNENLTMEGGKSQSMQIQSTVLCTAAGFFLLPFQEMNCQCDGINDGLFVHRRWKQGGLKRRPLSSLCVMDTDVETSPRTLICHAD